MIHRDRTDNPIRASNANIDDFCLHTATVPVDDIMSSQESHKLSIDIRIITVTQHEAIMKEMKEEMLSKFENYMKSSPLSLSSDFIQSISAGGAAASIKPMEITSNVLVHRQLTELATELGYTVCNNTSNITGSPNATATRFHSSRPDLVIYSPKRHCGFILMDAEADEENDRECFLSAGVTENKVSTTHNVLPQLLGGTLRTCI